MEKIKHLAIGTLLFILPYAVTIAQQQVSINEARNAAVQTLNFRQSRGVTYDEANVKKVNTLKNRAAKTLMYEVIFDDEQGVLLSGSKACLPVLGYFISENGQSIFNEDAPEGLKFLLEEYEEQIELCFQNDTIRLYYQNEWNDLQQPVTRANGTPPSLIIVHPLLTSRWGQSRPNTGSQSNPEQCNAYNYDAPDKSCGTCQTKSLAGCVAVAMAQIMYYWKYPVYNPFLAANQWDWCNMVDELDTGSPNYINERNAIARLIKNCGDAVDMDFGCSSSGARSPKAENAFKNFGYHDNTDFQRKFWHSNSTWKSRIKGELDRDRPVYYCSIGQHAFVCDGYGSDDKFHFNFGWRDSGDNYWFTLDDLTPDNSNFNSRQAAIFYIRPSGNQDYCSFSIPLSIHYNITYGLPPFILNPPPPHQNVPQTFTVLEGVPATFPASWRTIESGQTAVYTAHEQVILKPGFHAKAGSSFTARIEPCVGCNSSTSRTVNSVADDDEYNDDEYFNKNVEIQETSNNNIVDNTQENETKIFSFSIFPNPTNGFVTVDYTLHTDTQICIELYNMFGQRMKLIVPLQNQNAGTYCIQISVGSLGTGTYIVKATSGKQVESKQLIINP